MRLFTPPKRLIVIVLAILLGIITPSVFSLTRPSVLLKRSLLRRRLMTRQPLGGTLRLKRQLFREDIPRHRPLTGNTYYLHAGFPHPSRWHEGPQILKPHPDPVTHHHAHKKPALHEHEDLRHNNLDDHAKPELHGIVHPPLYQQHQFHKEVHHPAPAPIVLKRPASNLNLNSVSIQSALDHTRGVQGGVNDNSIVGHPPAPQFPTSQVNFEQLIVRPHSPVNAHNHNYGTPPKPISGHEGFDGLGGNFEVPQHGIKTITIPKNQHERKPKTVIHFHPVSVGNIINFSDDHKPVSPASLSYGPPNHVPGVPLAHKDFLSLAEPFIKTPFKNSAGTPDFLNFEHDNVQYGPPNHKPGKPLSSFDFAPMLPSYGPPVKPDDEDVPYGVALPVLAHLHSTAHHHHHHHSPPPRPPKRHRGLGRSHHQRQIHFHHFHHPPPALPPASPFFDSEHPTYMVHGHVPNKFISVHSPHFRSHQRHIHHQKPSIWDF